MDVLKLIDIKKRHDAYKENSFLLKIDYLNIRRGEFFGLVGPSGCGKTTLLKVIAGLYPVKDGKIYIEEEDVTKVVAEKRGLGMVFQTPLLFPHLTVLENIAFGLKIKKIPKEEYIKKVRDILQIVGLSGFENRYPHQLSGGQQQRIAIARAMVIEPKILLMDEPFSALDPGLREEMRNLIIKIHKEHKMTIVFVTHDREEAFILFDRMAIMKEGSILQVGRPKELYEKPSSTYIGQFLGVKNIFYGKIENNFFIGDDFKMKFSHENNRHGSIVLRPESLHVKKIHKREEKENQLIGRVKEISFQQGFLWLKIHVQSKMIETIQKAERDMDFQIGEEVFVTYDQREIFFIEG
ncbi:MAG: ABC transporter ATP-binding protein [Marinisporobacter sp.]|jgi:ABC-type Fe3+/spermidine/putrescine transport system ATPase subunit|nr:ABC transporter ATP-binding protein [Marinisporobacter sp.]